MSKSLPVRPSLEQLKKQAKELLKSLQTDNPEAFRRLQENHPGWHDRSAERIRAGGCSLADAQLVVAREYGSASWPKLREQVESIIAASGLDLPDPGKARGVTWKSTVYEYRTSKDGLRRWLRVAANYQQAFQMPGLYRKTEIDGQGQICWVEISDVVRRRQMIWWPNQKKARLTEGVNLLPEQIPQNPHGPFVWLTEAMKKESLRWLEMRPGGTGAVNVFRHFLKEEFHFAMDIKGRNTSWDIWIDQQTKNLVAFHNPGGDVFDPDNDRARLIPPEKEWSMGEPAGWIDDDIVFDAELDKSLFLLEPPNGYAVENWVRPPRPEITEPELLAHFGIVVDLNDRVFPDQIADAPSSEQYCKIWKTPKGERTAAEQKFFEAQRRYDQAEVVSPVDHFIAHNTVAGSFRYLGQGIKLGDKDTIVCWYNLTGAGGYRVVYGDFNV
jgi:hypothetical protein